MMKPPSNAPAIAVTPTPAVAPTITSSSGDEPLRSIHTSGLPHLLKQLNISLIVSTYQAGKVVLLRSDGSSLNTHFRRFPKPMGIAIDGNRLALGLRNSICELRNVPDVAAKLSPTNQHDACFLPLHSHTTGNIDIHEMNWGKEGLWFINTRFSCLCSLDSDHSFVPRWRPPFVSAYAPEDRCHLNGLALVDGQPRYVTALGTADIPGGWRNHKADGGILMDITDNRIITQNLSMPHSPRWYRNQLWVLESGCGTIAKVDPVTGKLETVAELPGFTRGLSFCGSFAFIGLSKVRESASFSGIPITKRLEERICGVWVVNIDTSSIVAFLKFEDAVQEIFAVEVLPNCCFPELIDGGNEDLINHSYLLPEKALAEVSLSPPPPEDVRTVLKEGDAAYHQKNLEVAAQLYRRCLDLDPHFITARYNLGIVLVDQGHLQEGIHCLQQVVAEDMQHAEAHNALGTALFQSGSVELALRHYEKAVASDPGFELAHRNLAVLENMGAVK
jgi:uncharacterized protein (TIGR03032 family)